MTTIRVGTAARRLRMNAALLPYALLVAIAAGVVVGPFEPRVTPALLLAVGAALLAIAKAFDLADALPWRRLLLTSFAAAAAWAVALALAGGVTGITGPVRSPLEYLPHVGLVGSPGEFLSSFSSKVPTLPTHVASHPPGLLLALWSMNEIGLGGATWAAALLIAGGAAAAPAALLAVREISGEPLARRAAPFLVVAPAAVWVATSADALIMGASTWAAALGVLAVHRGSTRYAIAAGVALGGALMLSYGAILAAVVPLSVAAMQRRFRALPLAAAATLAVLAAFALAGFVWTSGLLAAKRRYDAGVASNRGYWFFLVANLGAFALAVGPAVAAGLARARTRSNALLLGGLAAVALANVSGMSKGEVERIWLLFVPWMLIACASLRERRRLWLGAQAATAIAIQALVRTPW